MPIYFSSGTEKHPEWLICSEKNGASLNRGKRPTDRAYYSIVPRVPRPSRQTILGELHRSRVSSMSQRFVLKIGVSCAAGGLLLWGLHALHEGLMHSETAENVASVDWLPPSASNVSYYRSYMNTAYEFDISERAFRDWSRWHVEEIDKPVAMLRYSAFASPVPEPVNPSQEASEAYVLAVSQQRAKIDVGLYYERLQENGGGVWVAYDRESGRAFFRTAPR